MCLDWSARDSFLQCVGLSHVEWFFLFVFLPGLSVTTQLLLTHALLRGGEKKMSGGKDDGGVGRCAA